MARADPRPVRGSRAKTYRVERPEELRALESPARLQIVDTVAALGPSSVADVARHLGAKRESLYFHLKKLEEVGLLRVVGERGSGRRSEALYDTPGREIAVPHRPGDEASAESHARISAANLRLTIRELSGAFRSNARVDGPRRKLHVSRMKGWLDPDDLEDANRLLGELQALFAKGRRRPRASLFTLTTALLPDNPKEST